MFVSSELENYPTGRAVPPSRIDFKAVILDTNSLMAPFQFGFNLDLELERAMAEARPIVPTSVLRELTMLESKGNKKARAALMLSRKYVRVEVRGVGDAPIFNLAMNKGWPVMTQDRKLRRTLLSRGIPVLLLRGNGHIELHEP